MLVNQVMYMVLLVQPAISLVRWLVDPVFQRRVTKRSIGDENNEDVPPPGIPTNGNTQLWFVRDKKRVPRRLEFRLDDSRGTGVKDSVYVRAEDSKWYRFVKPPTLFKDEISKLPSHCGVGDKDENDKEFKTFAKIHTVGKIYRHHDFGINALDVDNLTVVGDDDDVGELHVNVGGLQSHNYYAEEMAAGLHRSKMDENIAEFHSGDVSVEKLHPGAHSYHSEINNFNLDAIKAAARSTDEISGKKLSAVDNLDDVLNTYKVSSVGNTNAIFSRGVFDAKRSNGTSTARRGRHRRQVNIENGQLVYDNGTWYVCHRNKQTKLIFRGDSHVKVQQKMYVMGENKVWYYLVKPPPEYTPHYYSLPPYSNTFSVSDAVRLAKTANGSIWYVRSLQDGKLKRIEYCGDGRGDYAGVIYIRAEDKLWYRFCSSTDEFRDYLATLPVMRNQNPKFWNLNLVPPEEGHDEWSIMDKDSFKRRFDARGSPTCINDTFYVRAVNKKWYKFKKPDDSFVAYVYKLPVLEKTKKIIPSPSKDILQSPEAGSN